MPQLENIYYSSMFDQFFFLFYFSYLLFLKYFLPQISQFVKFFNKIQYYDTRQLYMYQYLLHQNDKESKDMTQLFLKIVCVIELIIKYIKSVINYIISKKFFSTLFESGFLFLLY